MSKADALSCIPWESTQVEHMEPLIVKKMLQSKLESETSLSKQVPFSKFITEEYDCRYYTQINPKKIGLKNKWMMLKSKHVELVYGSRDGFLINVTTSKV